MNDFSRHRSHTAGAFADFKARDAWICRQAREGKPEIDIASELMMSVTRVRQIIAKHKPGATDNG